MSVGSTARVHSVEDCMTACETGEAAGQGVGVYDVAAQAALQLCSAVSEQAAGPGQALSGLAASL